MQSIEETRVEALKDACSNSNIAPLQVFNTPEILASILGHLSPEDFLGAHQAHENFLAVVKQFPALRRRFSIGSDTREDVSVNPLFISIAGQHAWACFSGTNYDLWFHDHNYRQNIAAKAKPNKKWMKQLDEQLFIAQSSKQVECFVSVDTDLAVTTTTFTLEPKERLVSVVMSRLEQVRKQIKSETL